MKYYKLTKLSQVDDETKLYLKGLLLLKKTYTECANCTVSYATYEDEKIMRNMYEVDWLGCEGWWLDPDLLKEVTIK